MIIFIYKLRHFVGKYFWYVMCFEKVEIVDSNNDENKIEKHEKNLWMNLPDHKKKSKG